MGPALVMALPCAPIGMAQQMLVLGLRSAFGAQVVNGKARRDEALGEARRMMRCHMALKVSWV